MFNTRSNKAQFWKGKLVFIIKLETRPLSSQICSAETFIEGVKMAARPRPLQTLWSLENCSSHFDYQVGISPLLLPPIPTPTIWEYSRIYPAVSSDTRMVLGTRWVLRTWLESLVKALTEVLTVGKPRWSTQHVEGTLLGNGVYRSASLHTLSRYYLH